MTTNDSINYAMACYLIDGFNISNWEGVTETNLKQLPDDEGGGYRATITVDGTVIEHMSKLGWLEAAEGCVRQALWMLKENR